MEMTIAEPIQTLEYLRDSGVFPFSTKEGVLYTAESIDAVIENMHKYKKIVDIVSLNGEEFKQCGLKELKEILEIIADRNDD